MYFLTCRLRETELLEALEGVVVRCVDLESRLKESKKYSKLLETRLEQCVCDKNNISSLHYSYDSKQPQAIKNDIQSVPDLSETATHLITTARSAAIAANVRLAMTDILNSPIPVNNTGPEKIPTELNETVNDTHVTVQLPEAQSKSIEPSSLATAVNENNNTQQSNNKYPIGSRVSFLWTSPGALNPVPWPGIVKDTNTLLRCNIPKSASIGDMIPIALNNGMIEHVQFEPGKSFHLGGNKLQIPKNAQPGKSVVWNSIKGSIGFRWYDVQLENCDRITRVFDNEIREYLVGDTAPKKDILEIYSLDNHK